jgi:hypothetical protein
MVVVKTINSVVNISLAIVILIMAFNLTHAQSALYSLMSIAWVLACCLLLYSITVSVKKIDKSSLDLVLNNQDEMVDLLSPLLQSILSDKGNLLKINFVRARVYFFPFPSGAARTSNQKKVKKNAKGYHQKIHYAVYIFGVIGFILIAARMA